MQIWVTITSLKLRCTESLIGFQFSEKHNWVFLPLRLNNNIFNDKSMGISYMTLNKKKLRQEIFKIKIQN